MHTYCKKKKWKILLIKIVLFVVTISRKWTLNFWYILFVRYEEKQWNIFKDVTTQFFNTPWRKFAYLYFTSTTWMRTKYKRHEIYPISDKNFFCQNEIIDTDIKLKRRISFRNQIEIFGCVFNVYFIGIFAANCQKKKKKSNFWCLNSSIILYLLALYLRFET